MLRNLSGNNEVKSWTNQVILPAFYKTNTYDKKAKMTRAPLFLF